MLTLVLAGSFLFKGGDDSAIVLALSKATDKSVCYLIAPKRAWHKAEIQFTRLGDLETILKRRYDFGFPEPGQEPGTAWSAGAYPTSFFYKQRIYNYAAALAPIHFTPPNAVWPLTVS